MSGDSRTDEHVQKPFYHSNTDLFVWHQFQGDSTNDCAAYSIAIVGNAVLNQLHFNGDTVAREMEQVAWVKRPVPHLTLRKFRNWATLPWGVSGYLQSQGIPAKLHWQGGLEDLLRNIREDRFTIVIIGEPLLFDGLRYKGWAHAKVLYGCEASPEPSAGDYEPAADPETPVAPRPKPGFYFVDPGFRKDAAGLPRLPQGVFWQDETEFKRQWDGMLGVYIEVGPRVGV